jgi:hypothetical protein
MTTTITGRTIRVLTIDPIWVWAIFAGIKLVENRSWSTRHRGELGIHAGLNKRREPFAREWIAANTVHTPPDREFLEREYAGRLIGVVDLVDCVPLADVPANEAEFAIGPVCWRLSNVKRFNNPFQVTGKQGMWTIEL